MFPQVGGMTSVWGLTVTDWVDFAQRSQCSTLRRNLTSARSYHQYCLSRYPSKERLISPPDAFKSPCFHFNNYLPCIKKLNTGGTSQHAKITTIHFDNARFYR